MRPILFLPHPLGDNGRLAHINSFQLMTSGVCARAKVSGLEPGFPELLVGSVTTKLSQPPYPMG